MFRFIFALILLVAAAVVSTGIVKTEGSYNHRTGETTPGRTIRWPAAILGALGIAMLIVSCLRIVKSTEVGVPVTLGRAGTPLDSGLHFVAPWTNVNKFGTTVQTRDLQVAVNGSDGGTMEASVTVRYRVLVGGEGCSVTELFKRVRSESKLESLVIDRETDDVTRLAFNRRPAFIGYTADRETTTAEIIEELDTRFTGQCVDLDRFLVTNLVPSPKVQESIDAAIAAEQNVNRAKQEAAAKREEAAGTADAAVIAAEGELSAASKQAEANELLTESLTPEVLQSQMIEAIATGTNKVVILPSDGGATPLINVTP